MNIRLSAKRSLTTALLSTLLLVAAACGEDDKAAIKGKDPATAPKVSVDRFSATAAALMVRTATNGLPAANAPVDFDKGPFVTQGFSPSGEMVQYYNFDARPEAPAPIYVLFAPGASMPIPGQLNIIDVLPGEAGYNDFWLVNKVSVPADYVANTYTSVAELKAAALTIEATTMLVNCPVVPEGSTATKRWMGGSSVLHTGWYKGSTVRYFTFEEKALAGATVATSPIFVTFNSDPEEPNGGPPSGFKVETASSQTHNVLGTMPTDPGYSPLWLVNIYKNSAFDSVKDLATANAAPVAMLGAAKVNCPVVQSGKSVAQTVPTELGALKTFLESKAYAAFKAEPAPHASTGPHGKVRTFVNDILSASLTANNTSHPQGAASVKELYSGDTIVGWAVLVKTQAETASGAGYFWYELLNGKVVIEGKGKSACTGCHSSGKDYVKTAI
jgi:hypothetical protein